MFPTKLRASAGLGTSGSSPAKRAGATDLGPEMTILKSATAALVTATIAFAAIAPISAPAFASDQGFEVAPVKIKKAQFKKPQKNNGFKSSHFDKASKKQAKYLAIGAAVGAIGYALLSDYENSRD